MQVVIDIPEDLYKWIKDEYDNPNGEVAYSAIEKGTVLPEGHGDLIDRDELKKHKYHDSDRYENAVAVAQIDWAPAVIPADKEETG